MQCLGVIFCSFLRWAKAILGMIFCLFFARWMVLKYVSVCFLLLHRCSRDKYAYLSNFRWYTGVLIDLSHVEVSKTIYIHSCSSVAAVQIK